MHDSCLKQNCVNLSLFDDGYDKSVGKQVKFCELRNVKFKSCWIFKETICLVFDGNLATLYMSSSVVALCSRTLFYLTKYTSFTLTWTRLWSLEIWAIFVATLKLFLTLN